MNKIILIAAFCLLAVANIANAQTKEQEKAYREELKRIKQMTPSEIKALMVKLDKKTRESEECDTQNEQLKQALSEKEQEIGELRASQLAQASEKEAAPAIVATPPAVVDTPPAQTTTPAPRNAASPMPAGSFEQPTGVYFRIQLAAERGNIEDVVSQELFVEQENGYSKLLKGVFYTLDDARKARNYFKKIGIKGAWIVGYENGTRIPVADAVRKAPAGTAAN